MVEVLYANSGGRNYLKNEYGKWIHPTHFGISNWKFRKR